MTRPPCACISGYPYSDNPRSRDGDSPTAVRVVASADRGAYWPDIYTICNECGRRWLKRTIGGYPQDEATVREEVTGDADCDEFFAMDVTTELSLAAQHGELEALAALLDGGADIERRSHIWETPLTPSRLHPLIAAGTALMAAVLYAHEKCIAALLERGADPNARSDDGQTPLNIAVRLGSTGRYTEWDPTMTIAVPPELTVKLPGGANLRIVEMLLERGADPRADGSRALYIATGRRHAQLIRLLQRAAPPPPVDLALALRQALIRGDRETTRLLLEQGADVNLPSHLGQTALIAAVGDAYVNGDKGTPLRQASDHRKELAELLLARGADVNGRDGEGLTPLMRAAWGKDAAEVLHVLLAAGADINAVNKDGETALIKAAWSGCVENVAVLLDHGADPHARDTWGQTALDVAEKFPRREVAQFLRAYRG